MSEPQNQPILNEMPSVIMALFLLVVGIEGVYRFGRTGDVGKSLWFGHAIWVDQPIRPFPAALNTQIETGVFSWFELKRYISLLYPRQFGWHCHQLRTAAGDGQICGQCVRQCGHINRIHRVRNRWGTGVFTVGSKWACAVWDVYGCLRIFGRTCVFALGGLSRCWSAVAPAFSLVDF